MKNEPHVVGTDSKQPREEQTGDLLPVRMLNESVYCPRLFYLMHVMGEWAHSVDTVQGRSIHRHVDRKQQKFPEPSADNRDEPRIRTRSIMLSSAKLNIISKMDLVEHEGGTAVPVEYKHGTPPRNPEHSWPPERVQLCAQGLILEEHGWVCDHGILYFPGSRERIEIPFDENLRKRTLEAIVKARSIEKSPQIPRPLEDSPKCPRCSLVGICLPDETRLLRQGEPERRTPGIRRLLPARDDALPLHVTTPGARISLKSKRLLIKDPGGESTVIRFKDLSHVNLFGGIQITTQAVQRLLGAGIPIGYFSSGGWFYGVCSPIGHSAVQLRRRQYARSVDETWSLNLARHFVRNKIRNCRTLIRRNHHEHPEEVLATLKELAARSLHASDTVELMGIEGLAARNYFSVFSGMIKEPSSAAFPFSFSGRNRRPPKDPVNALLSLAYTLLLRHFTAACSVVGLDPHVGFLHADRPGRPSLALDLMEPFRPLIADSTVITTINNGEITSRDFISVGDSCAMTDRGRKTFIGAFERRLDVLIRHPVFGYRISYRRVFEVQTRLLARHVYGELPEYPAFETR